MKLSNNLITTAAGIVLESAWRGYVASVLWAWFIVPTFAAKPIGVVAAIGVCCLSRFVTFHRPGPDAARNKPSGQDSGPVTSREMSAAISRAFFGPLFTLAFAAVLRLFL